MRYTYSDDGFGSDDGSRRNSGVSTPLDTGPTVTASGRQVKSRVGGAYGESILVDQRKELDRFAGEGHLTETSEDMPTTMPQGRAVRTSRSGRPVKPTRPRYGDAADSDQSDGAQSSGKEWSGDENEPDVSEPELDDEEEDEDMDDEDVDEDEGDENTQESLVVQLRYRKGGRVPGSTPPSQQPPSQQLLPPLSNGVSVVINGHKSPHPPRTATEQTMNDTIDVAPRLKMINGTDGNTAAHYDIPQALRPVVEIAVQPMDVS